MNFKYAFLNCNLILYVSQFDHFEFLKLKPKLEKTRRCFESRSINNLFLKRKDEGKVLYLIQL